jgi:hypothetical protein
LMYSSLRLRHREKPIPPKLSWYIGHENNSIRKG